MEPTQFWCFEGTDERDAFRRLYQMQGGGSAAPNYLAFTEWVNHFFPEEGAHPETRLKRFAELLPEAERPRAAEWLFTVEKLRESLVLTHEDADYCLSALPETPRTKLLLSILHQYIDSELADDWTQRAWRVRDAIRAGEISLPEGHEVSFIQSSPSNFLFPELAASFQLTAPNQPIRMAPTWHWQPGLTTNEKPMGALLHGAVWDCLNRLVDRAARLRERHISEPILIPFLGTAHALEYLRCRFAAANLSVESYFTPLEHRSRQPDGRPVETTKSQQADALLLPLEWLPQLQPFHVLAFVDDTLLKPHRPPLLLRENELLLLERQGFSLPKLVDYRGLCQRALQQLLEQRGRSRWLFCATEIDRGSWPRNYTLKRPTAKPAVAEQYALPELPRRALSATQLETYAACPAKYFAQNLLRLRPPQTWEGQYGLRLGQLVHLTLERVLAPGVNGSRHPDLFTQFTQAFTPHLAEVWPEVAKNQHQSFLLQQHYERLMRSVAAMEKHLEFLFGPVETIAVEQSFEFTWQEIRLVGNIDRLVRTQDNSLLVLDYKTGSVDFSPNHLLDGSHFQAFLYLMAARRISSDPVVGMLFYDLKEQELRRGLVREEAIGKDRKKEFTRGHVLSEEKWNALMRAAEEALAKTATHIRRGDFAPTPSSAVCGYCDHSGICRQGALHVG